MEGYSVMKRVKNIIIGFGKAGKTLAFQLSKHGEDVVLIEKSPLMYGGTCINVGCIPSKLLYNLSKNNSNAKGFKSSILQKNKTIEKLRLSNFKKISDLSNVTILTGEAHFISDNQIKIDEISGETKSIEGDRIFINTGAKPYLPDILGLQQSKYLYTSETLMNEQNLPNHLFIIGGGPLAVEFATTFTQFGSSITMLVRGDRILPKMEKEAVNAIEKRLLESGVTIYYHSQVKSVQDQSEYTILTVDLNNKIVNFKSDAVLLATGRIPNIDNLSLGNTHINFDNQHIVTDDFLRTNIKKIWALGDVRGESQNTYISLDDSRIVLNQLYGDGTMSKKQQEIVPNVVFTNPPLATIGLSEEKASHLDINYRKACIATESLPKSHIEGNTSGYLKVLVDDDDMIIGATFFAVGSYEIINIISLAMHQKLSYKILKNQIFTHPSMSESLNELFSLLD